MTRPYPDPFTTPDPQAVADSRIMDSARHAGLDGTEYAALHHWSVTDLEGFWAAVWDYFDIDADTPYEQVLAEERMPGARWFPGATLNYTHHALRNLTDDTVAIIALDETGSGYEGTGGRLRAQVASVAATLRDPQHTGVGGRLLPSRRGVFRRWRCGWLGTTWGPATPHAGARQVRSRTLVALK